MVYIFLLKCFIAIVRSPIRTPLSLNHEKNKNIMASRKKGVLRKKSVADFQRVAEF